MKKARAFALAILNGRLDDATLLPYLDGLVASGYEGVCFHPRDGMLVPYASRHYWERLDALVGAALARGLEVWHYDEFPYPSGAFGGTIPETMAASRVQTLGFAPVAATPDVNGLVDIGGGAFLALLRQTDGRWHDVSADCGPHFDTWVWGPWHNRFYTGTYNVREEPHERAWAERTTTVYRPDPPLQNGEQLLAIKVVTVPGQKGGAGQPDITLPAVTDRFLENVYRPLSEISRRHGLNNTPVFQDEATFHAPFPWNELVEAGLCELWGETWKTRLAALYYPEGPNWEGTRLDYRRLCARLLEENWFARVARFCAANNLQMAGHLPGEESVVGHWNFLGDGFKSLRHFDIPGYDIISSTIADDINRGQALGVKLVQSAAFWDGQKPTMAEVFAANSFAADLQSDRSVAAWLALHDIVQLFDHSTYGCSLSLRKYDAPPVNNRFNPLDAGRADLWRWHGWLCDLLAEFRFAPDTLILFPAASLARFQTTEWEDWRAPCSLLETWFHFAFARSLDAVLLPDDRLSHVEARDDGFWVGERRFAHFWVPPTPALDAPTAAALERFAEKSGFVRFEPPGGTTIFGGEPLASASVRASEEQLVEQGARFFDEVAPSPSRDFSAPRTLIQSLRRDARGAELLILQNPHDDELPVDCKRWPGELLRAPVGGLSSPVEETASGFALKLAPREIAVFRADGPGAGLAWGSKQDFVEEPKVWNPTQASLQTVRPQRARGRCVADNHLSLKTGVLQLENQTREFAPAPVSALWPLDVAANLASQAAFCPPYSLASLLAPLALRAEFAVELQTPLPALAVVLDAESLPPGARLYWNQTELHAQTRDLYDRGNQVFPMPASLLTAGVHALRIEAIVTGAAQGVLERPILTGRFLAQDDQSAVLRAARDSWQPWNGESWAELGWPEGFGPFDYEFEFAVAPDDLKDDWVLQLPDLVGVAEVAVNEQSVARLCWQPRATAPVSLRGGVNRVAVRVYGSWSNLFSALNRRAGGLRGELVLRRT